MDFSNSRDFTAYIQWDPEHPDMPLIRRDIKNGRLRPINFDKPITYIPVDSYGPSPLEDLRRLIDAGQISMPTGHFFHYPES